MQAFTIKNHILELTNTSIGDGDGAITVGGTFDLNSNALNMRHVPKLSG